MLRQNNGVTRQSHPTTEPQAATQFCPQFYARTGKMSNMAANDVEQFLTQVWDEPAFVVPSHIGGIGPTYYARSEGHWIGLDRSAEGFTLLPETEDADYGRYQTVKRYIAAMA